MVGVCAVRTYTVQASLCKPVPCKAQANQDDYCLQMTPLRLPALLALHQGVLPAVSGYLATGRCAVQGSPGHPKGVC